jgi:hypothetical protein
MVLARLRAWFRALVAPSAVEREIDDELRYHLERDAESFAGQGLTAEEARRAALRAFGGLEPAREAMRDAGPIRVISDLKHDTIYALRMLRRDPVLAVVATLTLALVIAANTAVFSVVNAVLLRPLNFPEPDRLVVIGGQTPSRPQMGVAFPDYGDWLTRNTTFERMGASIVIGGVLTGGGEPERVFGRAVTASFLPTLGMSLHLGRTFTDAEDRPGGERSPYSAIRCGSGVTAPIRPSSDAPSTTTAILTSSSACCRRRSTTTASATPTTICSCRSGISPTTSTCAIGTAIRSASSAE